MKNKTVGSKKWEKLKKYLQITHEEYSDRNGLPYCKNCGMSGEELIEDFEEILGDKLDLVEK